MRMVCIYLALVTIAEAALAQAPTPVGRGSYASSPLKGRVVDAQRKVDLVEETERAPLFLVHEDRRPVPSNKWYSNLVFQKYGTGLWAMPHKVDATAEGIELFYPTTFDPGGTQMISEFPLIVCGEDFRPSDSRAKTWSDWMVTFRMPENENRYLEVTLVEGMPYVWVEFTGVRPRIAFGANGGKGTRGRSRPTFFDLAGHDLKLPCTADSLGVTYEGRTYAVYAPEGTTFADREGGIDIVCSGRKTYLVLCVLPSAKDIAPLRQYAHAIPRDTRLDWAYDRPAGTITTNWTVTTEPLRGSERRAVQGWLPHHWRENASPMEFAGIDYPTMRGKMRCAIGNRFTITYPFHGILPNLPPPPSDVGLDRNRMQRYLREHFIDERKKFATDTYWGGKDLQRFAQAAYIASQIDEPSFPLVVNKLRAELENWFTFTPGEKDRYFAYYPRRKGLVGFNPSYGSEHFTDHHFHNGYFVFTAGLLCQLQSDFASQFGEMATLVAKSYANHDRSDQRFPLFRTFDIWRGHSFADGNGFPDGNNQESTGEAINSWAGMILLGEATGDHELTAAGVMGYSFETRATREYWFDPHRDVFPSSYPHRACGMIWSNSIVWGTWFTANPGWIYGIQWLPSGPFCAFYDRDPAFIKTTHADMIREIEAFEEKEAAKKPGSSRKPADVKSQGGELASYHLGFVMHADPQWVIDQIDRLCAEPGDEVGHDQWMANIYYQAHSLRALGRIDTKAHGDSPTSMVYFRERDRTRTFIAWNPADKPRTVRFFERGRLLGQMEVAAHGIRATTQLNR